MERFEDKTVIVTGGSSGIGKAIVERFKEEGADVTILDIAEDGEEVAEKLEADYIECDVSDWEQVKDAVDSVAEKYGGLDVMVNNAGIGATSGIEEMTIEEWNKIISVDLDGVMHGTKASVKYLKESEGSIINIASIYGLVGDVGSTAYNAAKGGVVNFTRSVADDLAEENVRVNSVCPGFVRTAMTEEALEDEEFSSHVLGETPMGRVAEPEEVSGVVAFLASDDASYITGVNLPVDGGWTSH